MEVSQQIHVPALLSWQTLLLDTFDRLDGLQIWSGRLGRIRNLLHPSGVGLWYLDHATTQHTEWGFPVPNHWWERLNGSGGGGDLQWHYRNTRCRFLSPISVRRNHTAPWKIYTSFHERPVHLRCILWNMQQRKKFS